MLFMFLDETSKNAHKAFTVFCGQLSVNQSLYEKQGVILKELEQEKKTLEAEVNDLRRKADIAAIDDQGLANIERKKNLDLQRKCDAQESLIQSLNEKLALLDKLRDEFGETSLTEEWEIRLANKEQQIEDMKMRLQELKSLLATKEAKIVNLMQKIENKELSVKAKVASGSNVFGPQCFPPNQEEALALAYNSRITPAMIGKINENSEINAEAVNRPPAPAPISNDLDTLKTQVSDLKTLLNYREDLILKIYEHLNRKSQALQEAETEKDMMSAHNEILKKELSQSREDVVKYQQRLRDTERKGNGEPHRSRDRMSSERYGTGDVDRLRRKYDKEYDRRKKLESDNEDLRKELFQLKSKPISRPPIVPVKQPLNPADKNRITELQSQIKDLRTDNEAKRSELFDLRSRLEEKSTQLEQLTAKLRNKERMLSDLSDRMEMLQTTYTNAMMESEELKSKHENLESETKRTKEDVASVIASNKFLSENIIQLKRQLNTMKSAASQSRLLHQPPPEPAVKRRRFDEAPAAAHT